jgi:SAM-dependent methyltransferase
VTTLDRQSELEKFDRHAQSYESAHAQSVTASGETPEYFARHKLGCLLRLGASPETRVLDYGCGTGSLTRLLAERFRSTAGFDPSLESLRVARGRAARATFYESEEQIPERSFDLVVLSGVLHHVPPTERLGVVASAVRRLRAGGRLAVFEHNPFNPLTVRAVKACPFDDAAVLLPPGELRRLFEGARLHAVRQEYVLFFPRSLARLRPFEPWLRACPLGAQTLTCGIRG